LSPKQALELLYNVVEELKKQPHNLTPEPVNELKTHY
jgi:hypothetical protein